MIRSRAGSPEDARHGDAERDGGVLVAAHRAARRHEGGGLACDPSWHHHLSRHHQRRVQPHLGVRAEDGCRKRVVPRELLSERLSRPRPRALVHVPKARRGAANARVRRDGVTPTRAAHDAHADPGGACVRRRNAP